MGRGRSKVSAIVRVNPMRKIIQKVKQYRRRVRRIDRSKARLRGTEQPKQVTWR